MENTTQAIFSLLSFSKFYFPTQAAERQPNYRGMAQPLHFSVSVETL
jgi:hypothetical protein